jgi:glycosyltransferase involved in cell wall biosynthesis
LHRVLARPPGALGEIAVVSTPALASHTSPSLHRLAGVAGDIGVAAFVAYARLAAEPQLSPQRAERLRSDRDAVLHWYLTAYAQRHLPSRMPLAAADIDYLLAPDDLPDLPIRVPRIVAWEALLPHSAAPSLVGGSADLEARLAFWWTCVRAPQIGVADCLVPADYLEILRASFADGVSVGEGFLSGIDKEFSSLLAAGDRAAADLALIIAAIEQPGLLAILPARCRQTSHPEWGRNLAVSLGAAGTEDTSDELRLRLEAEARMARFDLGTGAFVGRDEVGNRAGCVFEVSAPALSKLFADIEVVGPVHLRSGLGQATRMSIAALRQAGAKVRVRNFAHGFPSPVDPVAIDDMDNAPGPSGAALFHLNPDMLPLAFARGPVGYATRRAGYFFWELDAPATCDFLALDLIDAIWTASPFVQGIYEPVFAGKVSCVGLAMPELRSRDCAALRARLRQKVRLAAEAFVFVSVFDGLSYIARKNPLGTVQAFRAAFPDSKDVALVLKTHNRPRPGGRDPQSIAWRQLEAVIAEDPRIRLLDDSASHDDVLDLVAGADAYLSLHRSEGFGLGPAEAMQLGVPVVATAYGGTEAFCSDDTAFRVANSLVPVGPDDYVHAEPGRVWAEPDLGGAVQALRTVRHNEAMRRAKVLSARARMASEFSSEAIGRRYLVALDDLLRGR